MRWAWIALAVACTGAPRALNDQDHYLASLGLPPAAALQACAQVKANSASGECTTSVAVRFAERGTVDDALAICAGIASETWMWECHLRVVEAAPLTGEAARQACAHSGRFERVCQFHALEAAVVALGWSDEDLGKEAAHLVAATALADEVRAWPVGGDVLAPEADAWTVEDHAEHLVHARLVERFSRRPFEARLCGSTRTEQCAAGMREALLRRVPAPKLASEVCGQEPLRDKVMDAGGMGWTTVSDPIARVAMAYLCEAVASGVTDDAGLVGQ